MDDKTLNKTLDGYETPAMSPDMNDKIIESITREQIQKAPLLFVTLRRAIPIFGVILMVLATYSLLYGPQSTEREIAIFLNETIALEIYEAEIANNLVTYEEQKEFEIFLLETDML